MLQGSEHRTILLLTIYFLGFDPALPLFDSLTKSRGEMINSDAADFVDIYHSNMGFKGKKETCGDVDVYFNNGANQPGCKCSKFTKPTQ